MSVKVETWPLKPTDTILVHAGLYKGDRHNYVDPYGLTFDGTYLLTAKGTPEKPIAIKAAGDGEVIFDGDGAFRLFDVMGSAYNIFEGITFRNTEVNVKDRRQTISVPRVERKTSVAIAAVQAADERVVRLA